jgi:hypothetical protein
VKAVPVNGKYDWWVQQFVFPYTPRSYVAPEKPVVDEHGHEGGGEHH